jgi:arginyl-tRNA synthetase
MEMTNTAKEISQNLGKLEGLCDDEKNNIYKTVGLGALKYYILKVDPKKRILFDPKESVDFQGNTASFIQYSYARIQSILNGINFELSKDKYERKLEDKEKELIKQIDLFPSVIKSAANSHNPSLIANYIYDLVKSFNSFYQSLPILKSAFEDKKTFRVELSKLVGITIKNGFALLGIGVVDRM